MLRDTQGVGKRGWGFELSRFVSKLGLYYSLAVEPCEN